ncbi:hypothetical protein C8R47DRAFT_915790, partial [Mycena vitilis]
MEEIRSAILRHKSFLEALEQKQIEVEIELSGAVYPILTIAPEIISRIFLACLPDHGRVRPSVNKPPLVLAQICRQWREIALSLPELWASVDLRLPS